MANFSGGSVEYNTQGRQGRHLDHIPNYRVLLVDDSVDSMKLLNQILERHNCNVTMAFDGADSIPLLVNEDFDLVVLDWQMPQMGGRETLIMMDRLIKEHKVHKAKKKGKSIPVVIFTGHDQNDIELPPCDHFSYSGFIRKEQGYSEMTKCFTAILRDLSKASH